MKTPPKRSGHVKPAAAMKHTPEGYAHMKDCPMCKGKGVVPAEEASSLRSMLVKKA